MLRGYFSQRTGLLLDVVDPRKSFDGSSMQNGAAAASDVERRRGGGLLRARRLRCETTASTRSLAAAMAEQRRTHTKMGMADGWVHARRGRGEVG
jgi:hypothetical protein